MATPLMDTMHSQKGLEDPGYGNTMIKDEAFAHLGKEAYQQMNSQNAQHHDDQNSEALNAYLNNQVSGTSDQLIGKTSDDHLDESVISNEQDEHEVNSENEEELMSHEEDEEEEDDEEEEEEDEEEDEEEEDDEELEEDEEEDEEEEEEDQEEEEEANSEDEIAVGNKVPDHQVPEKIPAVIAAAETFKETPVSSSSNQLSAYTTEAPAAPAANIEGFRYATSSGSPNNLAKATTNSTIPDLTKYSMSQIKNLTQPNSPDVTNKLPPYTHQSSITSNLNRAATPVGSLAAIAATIGNVQPHSMPVKSTIINHSSGLNYRVVSSTEISRVQKNSVPNGYELLSPQTEEPKIITTNPIPMSSKGVPQTVNDFQPSAVASAIDDFGLPDPADVDSLTETSQQNKIKHAPKQKRWGCGC